MHMWFFILIWLILHNPFNFSPFLSRFVHKLFFYFPMIYLYSHVILFLLFSHDSFIFMFHIHTFIYFHMYPFHVIFTQSFLPIHLFWPLIFSHIILLFSHDSFIFIYDLLFHMSHSFFTVDHMMSCVTWVHL